MGDGEDLVKPFFVDYDKRGTAKCKKCKEKLEKGLLRIARNSPNPFGEGMMKNWYHLDCLFESFKKARATTKKLEVPIDDIDGWEDISEEDQKLIKDKIKAYYAEADSKTPQKKATPKKTPLKSPENLPRPSGHAVNSEGQDKAIKDNLFKEFRKICARIAEESSYLEKTEIVSNFFKKGTDGESFKGDLRTWVKLLLPGVVKRVYNLQSRQLTKLFSQLFDTSQEEMLEDLEKGDIGETVRVFFECSKVLPPIKKSSLTIGEVDALLTELEGQTTEDSQSAILKKIAKRSTGNDLKMIIRLIKGDLRINAGAKHILDGIHSDAYEAFQTNRNLDAVLDEVMNVKDSPKKGLNIQAKVLTPILPMLAQACRSVEQAMKKCPNGMYAEIKYDGERVQVHKVGTEFKYFSRSLKPVIAHKVAHFKDYIPSAFPHGNDIILDAEVLLIDMNTGLPLPFGTLGKHKKEEFKDANVCLFVFDIIHFNGVNLMNKPIIERRKKLEKNIVEIKNRVVLSEMQEVHDPAHLQKMIQKVLKQGLEGLVLKDLKSTYEPGKRHWLKVKKDYLQDGAMADTADLVVLGAWYGTGKKGGIMSIFLMGCFDPHLKKWCTVTKVSTGLDDAALNRIQDELNMVKIGQKPEAVPSWLKCSRTLTPDFIAKDPKMSPVWEITGAEFTKNQGHTADGISIRFPRVTKERSDKTWEQATNLNQLKELYKISKEHTDIVGLRSDSDGEGGSSNESPSSSKVVHKGVQKKDQDNGDHKADKKRKREERDKSEQKKVKKGSSNSTHGVPKEENGLKFKKIYDDTTDSYESPVKRPLPNIFKGVYMYLSKTIEDYRHLYRYFIAFGGEEVDEFDQEATHRIRNTSGKSQDTSYGEPVSVDWLWDSIKLLELQPTLAYK